MFFARSNMFWVKFVVIPASATIILAIFLRQVLKKFDIIDGVYNEMNKKRQLNKQIKTGKKELEKLKPMEEKAEEKKDKWLPASPERSCTLSRSA